MLQPVRPVVDRIRLYLGLLLIFSFAGTAGELVLAKHYDSWWKLSPLVLFGAGIVAMIPAAKWPGRGTIAVFRGIMLLFLLSGLIGIYLHYRGKAEFALERHPDLTGLALWREAIWKGTNPPLLAPGTMLALGLLGLVWTYGAARPLPPTHSTGAQS